MTIFNTEPIIKPKKYVTIKETPTLTPTNNICSFSIDFMVLSIYFFTTIIYQDNIEYKK